MDQRERTGAIKSDLDTVDNNYIGKEIKYIYPVH